MTATLRTTPSPIPAIIVCCALGGCASSDDLEPGPSTVTIAYWEGKEAFSPTNGEDARRLVYLPLMDRGRDGEWRGRLARSWDASPDGSEWTYHLRTEVRWHDGVPVTARDVAFTIDLMSTLGDIDGDTYSGSGAIESVVVHDDSTITIRAGHGRLSYQRWLLTYPRHLLEGLDREGYADWSFWTHPVGSGPYRFVRYEPLRLMEFEANPDFYSGRPTIERVILKASLTAGLTELLAGTVDAVPTFPAEDLPIILDDSRFRVYHWAAPYGGRALYWNTHHPLFRDPSSRRALTYAIDRRELHRLLHYPESLPILDGIYTPDQVRRGEFEPELPYDPDAARQLLDRAGWRDTDGDGTRDRDGQPFHFTAKVRPERLTDAIFVQSQLRRIGVEMEIQTGLFGWTTAEEGEYEALFHVFRVHEPLWLGGFRDQPGYWRNDEFVELLDRVDATIAPRRVDSLYSEMSEIFRRELPLTFLHPFVRFTVAHRRLRGLSSPYWAMDPTAHMDELWLDN